MASRLENGFDTYEFSDEELISAATFNILQRMYIQTQRAGAAIDLLALDFDPEKAVAYSKARGFQEGFIAACDFFLDHEKAEDAKDRWKELKNATRAVKD